LDHPHYNTVIVLVWDLAHLILALLRYPPTHPKISLTSIISMHPNNQADSPTASSEDERESAAPVVQVVNAVRTQHKLTKEERAYLATRLPEYHALQATLAEKGEGPRGLQNIKGDKKAWVRAHVFEDFKKKFNSAAPGGSALDSVLSVRSFPALRITLLTL
jgi:hypothetical protein